MSFTFDVAKWAAKAGKSIEETRKSIILELFNSVILDTPVLSGRLRGNWTITNGTPASGTVEFTDTTGNTTTAKVKEHVATLPNRDGAVFLTNNLPYAYRIEFDGWSHTKAPEGMVRKNFVRITNILKAA